jgi:FtsP/CotA-like multicopper oxidase with cupredoxin domain
LCPTLAQGALVPEPPDLSSVHGVLKADLTIVDYKAANGAARYCYRTRDGRVAPTLRVRPGDMIILRLTNKLKALDADAAGAGAASMPAGMHHVIGVNRNADPCDSGAMTATSTNLHFHGMTMPAVCHQDEVLKTSIQPGAAFEYRFRVPDNEPPGLYWYHPHIHGFSSRQVTGGASGAMIVEGIERAIPEVAGLPERVFVIRDPKLLNPDAPPSTAEPVVAPPFVRDADGDAANNNTGYGTPARDLSVNFVPVPYPGYPPAKIRLRPRERQLWRVLNASAITYIHLSLLYDKAPQPLGVVALDGVPVDYGDAKAAHVKNIDHLVIPPGSRAEFIVTGPAEGVKGQLITRMVDTGQDGENDPNRALASVEAAANAPEPRSRLPAVSVPLPPPALPWVGTVAPVRTRKLILTERRADPNAPNSPVLFFITVEGQAPKGFDSADGPNITARQGDVEDWIIENRSLELHDFHIHQVHFQLREWFGYEVDEPFLRDTVSVPFFENHMSAYPSVRIRVDFRDANAVGTYLYHCHLLEHEDGGMMGTIRVEPAPASDPAQGSARG